MAGSKVPDRPSATDALRTALESVAVDYSPWFDRADDRQRVDRHGMPTARSEAWKYSNVDRLYERLADAARPAPTSRARATHVTAFEDLDEAGRRLVAEHSGRQVDPARYPLAAVSRLMMDAASLIHVPRDTSAVVELLRGAAVEYVLAVVEDGASLELLDSGGAAMRTIECVVGGSASVRHHAVFTAQPTREYRLFAAALDEGANLEYRQYGNGGELHRNDVYVGVDGRGATADLSGAWLLADREHLDTQIAVHHNAPGCRSRQLFRGVVTDRATAVFQGRIYIAPGADGADASLSNKNLLESTSASTFTKPELEIHAHDVVCSHGATVGQLDADALFYLRSRGVEHATAMRLLIRGFLREAVSGRRADEALALLEYAS